MSRESARFHQTALVLVDIQNEYFPGGAMELCGAGTAAARAGDVLAAFRDQGAPVFHVRHESVGPGAAFFLPGTSGAVIHPAVAPVPGEAVVTKAFPNSFRETRLLSLVRDSGANALVVCGMMTHMCVDATVRAGFDLGFSMTVVADACATRDLVFGGRTVAAADVQAAFLAALGAVYATVGDAAALLS